MNLFTRERILIDGMSSTWRSARGRRQVPCGESDCCLVHRDWIAERLARSLSHPKKQRLNGQALYEDGKGDDSKTDGNYFLALRNFKRKSKRKSQR